MLIKRINVLDFDVDVYDFGYASYFYPSFNHDTEFKVNRDGYKKLKRYLKTVKWVEKQKKELLSNLITV